MKGVRPSGDLPMIRRCGDVTSVSEAETLSSVEKFDSKSCVPWIAS